MKSLKPLVLKWIRAEYAFRYGPRRYSRETQAWLLDAEDRLRRAVVGRGDLGKAGRKLGCKSDMRPVAQWRYDPRHEGPRKVMKTKRRKAASTKSKRRKSLQIGIFRE